MSLVAIWSVFCDVSGPRCDGWIGEADTKSEAVKVARADGWKKTRRYGWVCPKCWYEKPEEATA